MSFPIHRPPRPLQSLVAVAHGYRVPANPTGLHRGLPSRHLTLVVELTGPLRVTGVGGRVAAHGIVGGLHTQPVMIDASGPQEGLQYALTPVGAQALLGVPAVALAGCVVDLADLIGSRAGELVEQLSSASSWTERFGLLDAALMRRLSNATSPVPAEVAEAWRMIFSRDGRIRVTDVAGRVGWGRRHLTERFRLATGLTPKEAARIARFEEARRFLLASQPICLAEVATRCGYADQPHFAREWRAFSGCSVSTWLREELPFVQDSGADRTSMLAGMSDLTDSRLSGPPTPTVWPSVGFSDVDAGVGFLTEALGFVITALYRGDDGSVEHAEARWPDGGGVMFGSRGKPGLWGELGPQGMYVVAALAGTVDDAWNRVRAWPGVVVLQQVHDTDYGSHQFDVRDMDGNLWTVGTYRGA